MKVAAKCISLLSTLCLYGCMQISPPTGTPWPSVVVGAVSPPANFDVACIADYRPDVDYFPHKTSFRHSTQLQVEYGLHYKRVRFTPSVLTGEVIEFLLVQCGAPIPDHGPHVPVVQVPIQRLVTGNSSVLRALDELGLVDRLHGSENIRNATVPAVRERIARGLVHDMRGYGHASIEQVMSVKADVYLSFYSAYPQGNMHPRLWELGVRALPQADHHEPHPLGRAEWLKLLALLANREERANRQFDAIERRYRELSALARNVSFRPTVLAGFAASRDSFETFGVDNQRAQLIRDAGGQPAISDGGSSSLIYLPFEKAYLQGAHADVWLGTLGGQADVDALVAANRVHGMFDAADRRQVYAWDRGYTGAWAYPYQDQSMTLPHVQLAEAIAVLHPERLPPSGEPTFLRKLP